MVGPALPLRSKSWALWLPRYQSRACQPIVVGSRAGSRATQESGAGVASTSPGSHVADLPVEVHGLRADRGQGGAHGAGREAGPPADVGLRAGSEALQPAGHESGPGCLRVQDLQRRAQPTLHQRPAVLAADPRAPGPATHDTPLRGQDDEHAAGDADVALVRLADADAHLAGQAGHGAREFRGGGLPSRVEGGQGGSLRLAHPAQPGRPRRASPPAARCAGAPCGPRPVEAAAWRTGASSVGTTKRVRRMASRRRRLRSS